MTMKRITLTTANLSCLNSIRENLSNKKHLTIKQRIYLEELLSQLPIMEEILLDNLLLNEAFELNCLDTEQLEQCLAKWKKLFNNIPGYDYAPSCWLVANEDRILLSKNVIMTACFAPTMSYNASHLNGYYIHLKDDGTAKFCFPTFEDAEKYPELYTFKGSWKEAYYLLIETLKKGWPMQEFPKELLPLLKE